MGRTLSSVMGRPEQRSARRALASSAGRGPNWPLPGSCQKQRGSWLLGLAVLITIVTASSFGAGKSDVSGEPYGNLIGSALSQQALRLLRSRENFSFVLKRDLQDCLPRTVVLGLAGHKLLARFSKSEVGRSPSDIRSAPLGLRSGRR